MSSATSDKLLSFSGPLCKGRGSKSSARLICLMRMTEQRIVKPNSPHVHNKSETNWSHFTATSKATELVLLSWESHKGFIWDVNGFLIFICFLPPPTPTVLPSHVHVSLSRVIHVHRLPTAVPTTWKPTRSPVALLPQGSHSSNAGGLAPYAQWKVSPRFLLRWY